MSSEKIPKTITLQGKEIDISILHPSIPLGEENINEPWTRDFLYDHLLKLLKSHEKSDKK
jgi:hypothetical protein